MSAPSVEFYQETIEPLSRKPAPEWRWRLSAENGEIVATGEGHESERDAHRAFEEMTLVVIGLYGYAFGYAMHAGALPGMVPE